MVATLFMVVNLNFWMLKSCEMPLKRASHHHPLSKSWRSTHDLPKVFFSNVIISWSVGNLAEKLANSGARMALLVQCLHDRQKNLWRRGAKSLESCRSAEAAQQRWEQQIFPLGFVWESGTPLILIGWMNVGKFYAINHPWLGMVTIPPIKLVIWGIV